MRQSGSRGRALGALSASLFALALATPAGAQSVSPGCAGQPLLEDACQKAADIFTLLTPQLGTMMAGGNVMLGQAGALGRPLRFALGVRATGLRSDLPEVESVSVQPGPARRDAFPVQEQFVALPQVDLAVGLFGGIPLSLTNVGAVDVLLTGMWVPELDEDDVQLRTPNGRFKLGYGARLGILQETITLPSLAVTYMRRELPEFELSVQPGGDDTLSVAGTRVRTDSWRVVAGKRFLTVSLAVGGGQDRYDARTALSAVVREGGVRFGTLAPVPFAQEVTRSTLFADLGLRLGVAQLVGEVGRVWGGGGLTTFNEFAESAADEARLYVSAGLRVGF